MLKNKSKRKKMEWNRDTRGWECQSTNNISTTINQTEKPSQWLNKQVNCGKGIMSTCAYCALHYHPSGLTKTKNGPNVWTWPWWCVIMIVHIFMPFIFQFIPFGCRYASTIILKLAMYYFTRNFHLHTYVLHFKLFWF